MYKRGTKPQKGITILPMGGLGNQLFIYAAGYAAANRQECPLYIDDSWYGTQTLRKYELDTFSSEGLVLTRESHKWFSKQGRHAKVLPWLLKRFGVPPWTTVDEEGLFIFSSDVAAAKPGFRLGGYLQSYRYFQEQEVHIREQLLDVVDPSPWFFQTQNMLTSLQPWIAVHIRRGDYFTAENSQIHGIISEDYYSAALKIVRTLIPGATYVIFSDDLQYSRQLLQNQTENTIFMEYLPEAKAIETLILMSQSSGSIIANSTFSWWGAWLGDRSDRPVIAPRPWMKAAGVCARDLLPRHWLTLGT